MKISLMILNVLFSISVFAAPPAGSADVPAALKEDSLYQLDNTWVNQDGKTVTLKDFRGHPVIISMVYLTCKYLCPTIISEIQGIENKLSEKTKANTRIVLVSFDPDRDTVQVMKAYMAKRKLDPNRWSFLTNSKDSKNRELAVLLNFKYQKTEDGEFSHSFLITILDKEGVVAKRQEGANKPPQVLVDAIEAL